MFFSNSLKLMTLPSGVFTNIPFNELETLRETNSRHTLRQQEKSKL